MESRGILFFSLRLRKSRGVIGRFQEAIRFTDRERRDIFLDAVFLWITPFFAALSIIDLASCNSLSASSCELWPTAERTLFTACLTRLFTALFLMRLFSFCLIRLIADLLLANFSAPFP
jgi:hypothetical protein